MATPVASGGISSANSTPRWGRSGEPGSAFNGLSRPGRGRGRGSARGGRGGSRGGTSTRDSKPDDDHRATTTKADNLQVPSTAPKPSGSSSFSASPSIPEKSITSSPTSKPAKPPSRRASRTIPPAVSTQIQAAEVAAVPASARLPNRRRRSQTGKPSAIIPPPKINPPAPNDNLLRPNKPRLGPVPHTAPVKDTPPHLNQKVDMRNDIDALVERVRAVAMDHRPTTPGSHIDWAGDDDDSLPDLDDWGVTPATFNTNKLDVISPIIVGGLRPLPDITSHSIPSSPLKQVQTISSTQESSMKPEQKQQSPSSKTNLNSRPIEKEPEKPSINVPKVVEPAVKQKSVSPVTPKTPNFSGNNSNSTSRRPIHPSLPAKPAVGSSFVPPKSRSGAGPIRNAPYPKSPVIATTTDKGQDPKSNTDKATLNEVPAVNSVSEEKIPIVVERPTADHEQQSNKPKTPEHLTIAKPEVPEAAPQTKSAATESLNKPEKDTPAVEGLAASIHAPKAMSDSVSAPANLSTYPDLPSHSLHGLTHTRAHTVGRPPSFPKSAQGEYIPRFARSGHSTPRGGGGGGGFHESYHARTHSSPPAGAMGNSLRAHPSTRPVITGDAISRLARTIGKTGASAASKPHPVVPLGE